MLGVAGTRHPEDSSTKQELGSPQLSVVTAENAADNATTWNQTADYNRTSHPIYFDQRSFLKSVHPMQHSLNGRPPLLVWKLPSMHDHELLQLAQQGLLRGWVQQLVERGIVPIIRVFEGQNPAGGLALAAILAEANQPIYLLIPQGDFLERHAWKQSKVWTHGSDARLRGRLRRWPCLPTAQTSSGAKSIQHLLKPFQNAEVSGVFSDFEGLPNPYNGIYTAQKNSVNCSGLYPHGTLGNFNSFVHYTFNLKNRLLSDMLAEPVLAFFPDALVGNYKSYESSKETPFYDESGTARPPCQLDRLNVMMPKAYANNGYLRHYIRWWANPNQDKVDWIHLAVQIRIISSASQNKNPRTSLVPFISRKVVKGKNLSQWASISSGFYRELVRHVLLRGVDGLYLFNAGPKAGVTATESFESVEDARAVYDELLAYPRFLQFGEPMNLKWPRPDHPEIVWSGLRLADRCLIRTFAPKDGLDQIKIRPWPNRPIEVTVSASDEGQTAIIHSDGSIERVDHCGPK